MKVEIAIALFDSHGGVEEGDVIVCRKPSNGIGKKEAEMWLWFRADISEELASILDGPLRGDPIGLKRGPLIKKSRFNIPLEAIKGIDSNFDIGKARDLKSGYQPYLPLGDGMLFSDPDPDTFALENLKIVWDKSTGAFI